MDANSMSDDDKRGGGTTEGPNTGVVVKARPKTRKPAMYKVLEWGKSKPAEASSSSDGG